MAHEEPLKALRFDLRRARINQGLSIRGLAREVGVAEQTIRRLERHGSVRPWNALPIAQHFGVEVVDLLPLADVDPSRAEVA